MNGTAERRAYSPDNLLGQHLERLLSLIIPTRDGREVAIDGYKLLSDRGVVRSLNSYAKERTPEPADQLELYEPRLVYIRSLLQSLLNLVELEVDGKPVRVDGFRLKNLDQWLTPGGGAADILAHAASRCNLSCRFCYNKGAPPVLKPKPRAPEDEYKEIETRISHYVPRRKLSLFAHMGSPSEALAHPHILDILRQLRRKTSEAFRIPTNGSALTPQMVEQLSKFAPINLDVSLNSSAPERRAWLMNDPRPETAIDSLALLREHEIPFTVVVTPWPHPSRREMLDDLRKTVAFADRFEPALTQISLPGYARTLENEAPFPTDEVWNELKDVSRELRAVTGSPIVIRPGLFENYDVPESANAPVPVGVIRNSPAANARLAAGDEFMKINGLAVQTVCQARSMLSMLHQSDLPEATLSVRRNGRPLNLKLELSAFGYPYTRETATHLGAVFASSGIPRDWIERLRDLINAHQPKEALLFTSRLVRPTLERMLSRNGSFSNVRLHLRVPENEYFGGNIFMGDLLVVEDFIRAVRHFMEQQRVRPELIIVPSSPFQLSGWGRDLTGRVYLDMERRLGIPVRLVECDPIFD